MRTIQLNKFLDMCGKNLASLTFAGLTLKYLPLTASNTPPSVYYQIKKLKFVSMALPNDIDTFMLSSFTQLHTLKFRSCFITKKEKRYFMLPNTNLHYLQVLDEFNTDDYVLVLTLCNNEKRMYEATRGGFDIYIHEGYFSPQDTAINPPILSVLFESKPVLSFSTIIPFLPLFSTL